MKKIIRNLAIFFLILILFGVIALALLVANMPNMNFHLFNFIFDYQWVQVMLAAILAVIAILIVIAIVLLLRVKNDLKDFTIHNKEGDLIISNESIVSTVELALETVNNVGRYTVTVDGRANSKKVNLSVIAEINATKDFKKIAEEIESKTKTVLGQSLGIETERINIKLEQYDPNKSIVKSGHRPPRVI